MKSIRLIDRSVLDHNLLPQLPEEFVTSIYVRRVRHTQTIWNEMMTMAKVPVNEWVTEELVILQLVTPQWQ